MVDETPIKSHIVLNANSEKPSDSEKGVPRDSAIIDKIEEMRKDLVNILKVVTISTIADDSTSEEFLSTYENYRILGNVISKNGLYETKGFPVEEEEFSKNPIRCWIDILSISIMALHSFPNNTSITCDIIGMNDDGNKNERDSKISEKYNGIGMCYSTILNLEALDWKSHSISVFIPFSEDGASNTSIFMVDDDIKLFA